jgi:aarF domain-containing kinase
MPFILTAVVAAAAVPLVMQKSQDEAGGGDAKSHETFEQVMLDTSEDERKEEAYGINKDRSLVYRICRHVSIAFFRYIYEPIATGLRFVQLVFIFVPVIVTIPVIFIGSRDQDHDNDRSGTLWWYAFLVRQMERAGPTFIKVRHLKILC